MNLTQVIRSIWDGKTPTARRVRWGIKIAILLALFVVIFQIVPIQDVIGALLNADLLYLFLGLILVFLVAYLGAVQLMLLVRRVGINLNSFQILAINLSIKFYMLFLPNAFMGSGIRWYKLSKPNGKSAESLAAVAFNRLLDVFFIVVLGLGFWLLSGGHIIQKGVIVLVIIILSTALLWFGITRISVPIYRWIKSINSGDDKNGFVSKILRKTEDLLFAVSTYTSFSAGEFLLIMFVGTSKNLISVFSFMFLAMSVGIYLSYVDMGWIQSVVSLTAFLPFSIADGLGYREVSLVAILSTFSISSELALAFSFIIFFRGLLLGLVGGVIEAIGVIRGRDKL